VAGSGDGKKAHFASSELDMQARVGVGTVGYFGSPKYKCFSPHRRDLMHREVSLLQFFFLVKVVKLVQQEWGRKGQ
jgi:hypothetical protein